MKYILFALVSCVVLVACSDSPKPALQPAVQQEQIYTPMPQGEVIGLVQQNMHKTCELSSSWVNYVAEAESYQIVYDQVGRKWTVTMIPQTPKPWKDTMGVFDVYDESKTVTQTSFNSLLCKKQ